MCRVARDIERRMQIDADHRSDVRLTTIPTRSCYPATKPRNSDELTAQRVEFRVSASCPTKRCTIRLAFTGAEEKAPTYRCDLNASAAGESPPSLMRGLASLPEFTLARQP